MANIPYKYTPDAECERQWRRKKNQDPNNNFSTAKGNKEKFDDNYDKIDWSAKITGSKK